jgi:hypothetical protein
MKIFFACLFITLNILDIVSTRRILALGGTEVNPIAWILQKINLFLPIKIMITLILAASIIMSTTYNGVFLCGIISLFVINNYYQLYKYNKENL